jgi:uncharacterized DUF497 family protein
LVSDCSPAARAVRRPTLPSCLAAPASSQALRDPQAVTIEDPDADGEQRFVTLGADALGRVLVVVHAVRGDRVRLISARKASRGELGQYHA